MKIVKCAIAVEVTSADASAASAADCSSSDKTTGTTIADAKLRYHLSHRLCMMLLLFLSCCTTDDAKQIDWDVAVRLRLCSFFAVGVCPKVLLNLLLSLIKKPES